MAYDESRIGSCCPEVLRKKTRSTERVTSGEGGIRTRGRVTPTLT